MWNRGLFLLERDQRLLGAGSDLVDLLHLSPHPGHTRGHHAITRLECGPPNSQVMGMGHTYD